MLPLLIYHVTCLQLCSALNTVDRPTLTVSKVATSICLSYKNQLHRGDSHHWLELDTVAEWLRRWPAKPLCVARESSNLSGVADQHRTIRGSNPRTCIKSRCSIVVSTVRCGGLFFLTFSRIFFEDRRFIGHFTLMSESCCVRQICVWTGVLD